MRRGVPTVVLMLLVVAGLAWLAWTMEQNRAVPAVEQAAQSQAASILPVGDPATLHIMTVNVRLSEPEDGANAWPNRRELLVKTVLKSNPDLFGCQEVSPAQGAYLVKEFSPWYTQYPRAGVGKIEGDTGSRTSQLVSAVTESFASLNTLFYRTDRFDQIDGIAGLVLPDQPQAQPSENTFYTLAVLKQKSDGRLFIFVDTHIRHQQDFAVKCALRLRDNIATVRKRYGEADIILLGDINHDRNSPVYRALMGLPQAADGVGLLTDTFDYSEKPPAENWGNWHGFTGKSRAIWPTDLIFVSKAWKAESTDIIRDGGENGIWPSDHFFVATTLKRAE